MLTPSQFDRLLTAVVDLYEAFTTTIVSDIARRLMKFGGVTSTAAWQMQRLLESGAVYDQTLHALSEATGMAEADILAAFRAAGVESLRFDDAIYLAAGMQPLPLNLSPGMQDVLLAGLRKTMGTVRNLTMTTAISAQDIFVSALDMAYMQVTTGTMGYVQAIRAQVKDLARRGVHVIDYRGSRDRVDVAVRRAVLTGVAQTTGNLQIQRVREVGTGLLATSAHIGARPTHLVWQGRVFSVVGSTPQYPNFVDETGFGKVDGLCGINCRHSFYPFYPGISEPAYSKAVLHEYSETTVMYNKQPMPMYDATQKQRALEREIRAVKREAAALGAAGLENTEEQARVRELQAIMRDFIRQTGLYRQPEREGGRVETVKGDM